MGKKTIAVELTAFELGELTFALWEATQTPRYDHLRERLVQARVALFAANPDVAEYDRAKLTIERVRYSTTQGHVALSYAGTPLDTYGDNIRLIGKEWVGETDQYWHDAARRIAGRRGLCA